MVFSWNIQGGSDKSGIFKILLENPTAQRKIIRFYKTKMKLTVGHIENQDIESNGCYRRWQPWSWTWTSSRPSPRCPSQGSPSTPSSSGSGSGFCCGTLHWPITEKRHTQNSPKGCRQVSWEAGPPCPTPPGSSHRFSPASSCLPPTWVTSPHTIRLYLKSSDTIIFTVFVTEMFISCTRVLMGLLWSLVMSTSWLEGSQEGQNAVAAPLVHFSYFH